MGVIQLPGVLLCDDSITGGILIVSAIGLNRMPLSMTRKARAKGVFPICPGSRGLDRCVRTDFVCHVLTRCTNRETANRKVRTQAACAPADTHKQERGCLVCGFCVRWSWEGLTPRQRVWERRREISLCDTRLFIDGGEVEMDPNGSPLPRRAPPPVCKCHVSYRSIFNQLVLLRYNPPFLNV